MNDNLLITYCHKYFGLAMKIGINKVYTLEASLLILQCLLMYIMVIFTPGLPHWVTMWTIIFSWKKLMHNLYTICSYKPVLSDAWNHTESASLIFPLLYNIAIQYINIPTAYIVLTQQSNENTVNSASEHYL